MMDSPENDPPLLSGPAPAAAAAPGPDLGRAADATATARSPRRWTAVLLSLAAPGLGHLAIGHPRRMVIWYASLLPLLGLIVVGGVSGTPVPVAAAVLAAFVLRVASAVDTLRLDRVDPLPGGRNVLIMVVGFFVFWEIVSMNLRAHVIEAFQIPSDGTFPTLLVGDHIFATKLDRSWGRGDLVVFRFPMDPSTLYVKRIVGVPGDEVEIRDGVLIVNGTPVPRTRTSRPCTFHDGQSCVIWEEQLGGHRYDVAHDFSAGDFGPVTVPPSFFFVLGDNRENSSDSRVWGTVRVDLMVGKVTRLWWSREPQGPVRWERLNLRVD